MSATFSISSPRFSAGQEIPVEFTCDGADHSPPLTWIGPPEATQSFVLIVHDPDAPAGDWVHWVLYDIPDERRDLPAAVPARARVPGIGTQGLNDSGGSGWSGPCPPRGPSHRYRFHLLALSRKFDLGPALRRDAVLAAIRGHVLAEAETMGRYARQKSR